MDLYSVSQVADICKVSRSAIYQKLNLKDIKQYIVKRNNVTYINNAGLDAILSSLQKSNEQLDKNKEIKINTDVDNAINSSNVLNLIKRLEEENSFLREQIEEKDKFLQDQLNKKDEFLKEELKIKNEQLKIKDDQIAQSNKLIENTQILLREAQKQYLVEEVATTSSIKEEDKPIKKKGLFKRLFDRD